MLIDKIDEFVLLKDEEMTEQSARIQYEVVF